MVVSRGHGNACQVPHFLLGPIRVTPWLQEAETLPKRANMCSAPPTPTPSPVNTRVAQQDCELEQPNADDSYHAVQDRLELLVRELRLEGTRRGEGGNSLNPSQLLCVLGRLLGHAEPQFVHLFNADANIGTLQVPGSWLLGERLGKMSQAGESWQEETGGFLW